MRRRMLSPGFFVDDELVQHFDFCGRLFYQGLWCVAEDSGVYEPKLLALKMQIFPGDNIPLETLEGYLHKLMELGKIVAYEAGGKKLHWLKNFNKHQKVDKPAPPCLPLPPWLKWHGETELGPQRHKWYYELIQGNLPGREVNSPNPQGNMNGLGMSGIGTDTSDQGTGTTVHAAGNRAEPVLDTDHTEGRHGRNGSSNLTETGSDINIPYGDISGTGPGNVQDLSPDPSTPEVKLSKEKLSEVKLSTKHLVCSGDAAPRHTDKNKVAETKAKEQNKTGPIDYPADFEAFWQAYPASRRREKRAAFKAWQTTLKQGSVTGEQLITAAGHYAQEMAAKGKEPEYIKLPKTFLGPSRPYEDYLDPPPARGLDPPKAWNKLKKYINPQEVFLHDPG